MLYFAVDGDGSAGSNFVMHRGPFYIATNRACFVGATDDIDLEYVYFSLLGMKADHGFSDNYKAYKAHLEDVLVSFPVNEQGLPDLALQKSIAVRLAQLVDLRDDVVEVLDNLKAARASVA